MPTTLKRDNLRAFATEHRQEFEGLLKQFVEIPTVSVDPSHLPDIAKGVELTVETIKSVGGDARVYKVEKGNPVVHAVFGDDANLPTVTVYNHMDVSRRRKKLNHGTRNHLSLLKRVIPTTAEEQLTTRGRR